MVSLQQFLQSWVDVGASVPGTNAPPPLSPALAEALLVSGTSGAEASAAILIGAGDRPTLAALCDACPNAVVLLVAPARALLAGLRADLAGGSPIDLDRCFVAPLPPVVDAGFQVGVLTELIAFLVDAEISPADVVVVGVANDDPTTALAEASVRDLCEGLSRKLLAAAAGDLVAMAPLLRTVGDYLFAVRDHYHALKYYWAIYHGVIAATGPDVHCGWRILECWAELGCSDWVDRWVDQPIFSDDFRAKIRNEVASDLEATRSFRAKTFDTNRAALVKAGAGVEPEAPTGQNIAQVTLADVPWHVRYDGTTFAVTRGEYALLVRTTGSILEELNPPPDSAEFRAVSSALASRDQPHAVVVGWVRHAWVTRILLTARIVSTLPGWRRLVFLIEPDVEALSALLGSEDFSKPLAESGRPFLGPESADRFVQWLRAEPNIPPPSEFIGGTRDYADLVRGVHRFRVEAALVNRERLDAIMNRDSLRETLAVLEAVARDERPPRPLRVMIATSLYSDVVQYAAVDLESAFKTLGHETLLVRENHPGEMIHYQSLSARTLEFRPDFAFLLNHMRSESKMFHPPHLPFVTWIQDELPALKDPTVIADLGPLDFAYGFSIAVRDIYRGLGYPHVGHLPFAISGEGLSDPIPTDCRNETVFPTHVTLPIEPAFLPGFGAWLEERIVKLAHIPVSMAPLSQLLDEASAELNFAPLSAGDRQQAVFYGLMLARRLDRIRVADVFLKYKLPLALYGKGWDEIPRFAPHHRGTVSGGAPLRKVLREHKLVLHRGYNMHPRLLEGFAVGTFVLGEQADTDNLPGEICDQFVLGREIQLFRKFDQMVTLVRRALADEPWRRDVIEAARARIKANHTYVSRARTVIEDLRLGIASYLASGS